MYNKTIFLFILFVLPFALHAQMADSTQVYIDSSLTLLKQHSLYGKKVKWDVVEKEVYIKAALAKNGVEAFDALTPAFIALGDQHAAYYSYNAQFRLPNKELENRYTDSIRAGWAAGAKIVTDMVDGVAYVRVPAMNVGKQQDIDRLANWLYNAIAFLAKQNPKGWIIDLRLNAGGNIRPMMAGLAPFFDDGTISYYINREGKTEEISGFKDGNFEIDDKVQAVINTKIPRITNAKIAVLTGPATASSAEGVAANFKQLKNTRLFGQSTAGLANSTNGFVFNNKQSYFLISTAYLGDKNKKKLAEYVEPHEIIKGTESFTRLGADAVVHAAVKWVNKK